MNKIRQKLSKLARPLNVDRITISHNTNILLQDLQSGITCNTDPSAPIVLLSMHCLIVMVCKYEQNPTKAIQVIEQNA